jgi:DDE superfamily endonuclease/Helix-turn-helix of DDE superfamily endonuclease
MIRFVENLLREGIGPMSLQFSATRLRTSASFVRLTGINVARFDEMLKRLAGPWDKAQRRKAKPGRPWDVGGLEDHLLIMLIYYRCYITQEFLGFFYNVNRSAICRAIQRIEKLARPLIGVEREPRISRKEAEALIVDCTEQPIQRPGTDAKQREHYSGKKKRHTLKTKYIITREGRIASASPSHPGSHHDLAIRRDGPKLPKKVRLYGDSAYQGHDKEHRNLEFPYKTPKDREPTNEEKEYNRGLSGFRVRVEHRIGRTKRFKIASERFRNPLETHHTKISIIAGLVNLEDGFGPF